MELTSAANRLLHATVAYSIFAVFLCAFVVLRLSWGHLPWGARERYSVRETALIVFPILAGVVALMAGIFLAQEATDILVVSRANPSWAMYSAVVCIAGLGLLLYALLSHIRESHRRYDILDASEDALSASDRHSRLLVLQAKTAVVWILAFVVGLLWLRQIANAG